MILHGFFFIALVGILLTLLGITRLCLLGYDNEIIHWLFGDTTLLSGLAFLLTGITFIITASKQHKLKNSVQYFSGIAIVILSCTFYLIKERIFNYENIYLYIYEYGNSVQLSPAAFFCLSLLGLSLLLLPLGNRKSVGILLQVLAIVILIFALIAFCGYALKLGLLYNEYQYLTIPIISIFGLMLASCGLWNIYWKNKWFHNLYKGREDQKVMMTIAMISVCVISLSGFATYKTLSYENEKVIQQEFKNYLSVYKKQFQTAIQNVVTVWENTNTHDLQNTLTDNADNFSANSIFQTQARSYHSLGFSAIALRDASNFLFRSGDLTEKAKIVTKLGSKQNVYLLWNELFILRVEKNIRDAHGKIFTLVGEFPLKELTFNLLKAPKRWKSTEIQICSYVRSNSAICYPTQVSKNPYEITLKQSHWISPMAYALEGKNDVLITKDYKKEYVVAAYSSIEPLGLGMVFKTNTVELFSSIRQHLHIVLSIILGSILISITVLYSLVQPLIKQIILSEKLLRDSEERLNLAISGTSDGLWDFDPVQQTVYYSPRFKKLLGYEVDEIDSSIDEFYHRLHPEDYTKHMEAIQNHLLNKVPYDVELRLFTKVGVYKWFRARGQATWDPKGRPTRMSGFLMDISQIKEVEKLKNEFVSIVSHELRTPLTSIRGSLELVIQGIVGEIAPKAEHLIRIAHKNCERLILLINDILDIQKIESGKMHFEFKWINLCKVITQAIEYNSIFAQEHGIRLVYQKPEEEIQIYADEHRLMQVITNLLSNAIKFSPAGETVRIEADITSTHVRVSVIDYGIGIPEKFETSIFSKFAQADTLLRKHKSGTGLGLNISKAIVEQFGGKINFYRNKEQKGTTFFFELPKLPSTEVTNVPSIDKSQRILVCEDQSDIANFLKNLLESHQFTVDVAFTAKQAKQLLEMHTYQLMTLDLLLPDEDGLMLIKQLRSQEKTKNLPIIVISVKASESKQDLKGNALSILDWLNKPIDQKLLFQAIETAVNTKTPSILYVGNDKKIYQKIAEHLDNHVHLELAKSVKSCETFFKKKKFDLVILDIGLFSEQELASILNYINKIPIILLSNTKVSQTISEKVATIVDENTLLDSLVLENIQSIIKAGSEREKFHE